MAVGCSDESQDLAPYLEFAGGGFVFNYRHGDADYGFVAKTLRPIPKGTIIEAKFENPDGGDPFVIRETVERRRLQYVFRTSPVHGVKANRAYRVDLRLLDPKDGRIMASYTRNFRSNVDQEVLPDRPTVIGPGHQPAVSTQ